MEEDEVLCDKLSYTVSHIKDQHDRVIIHVDIDCFYAQVELLLNPSLRGKPVGIKQKNIVVTCNYEARNLGVQKLMLIKDALEKCPTLILVNGEDLKKYREMSDSIYHVLQCFSPHVEKLGLDENFIDITHRLTNKHENSLEICGHVFQDPDEDECKCGCTERLKEGSRIAQEIRDQLKSELGITSCAGVAYNKLLAKLVGATHKPNSQTTLFSSSKMKLIQLLKYPRKLPGIGSSTSKKLEGLGIDTLEKLQSADLRELTQALGSKLANQVQQLSFGIDNNPVRITDRPKSIGAEDGFPTIKSEAEIRTKLKCLLARVWTLIERDGRRPTQVKLTVRKWQTASGHSTRESRQTTLDLMGGHEKVAARPLDEANEKKILSVLMNLFEKVVSGDPQWQVTLLGISFSGFPLEKKGNQSQNTIQKYFGASQSTDEVSVPPAKRGRYDETILKELPPDILKEVMEDMEHQLASASTSKQSCESNCPKGVDPEVFSQLPEDIQKELLAENEAKKPISMTKKPNNLLQYFRKS